MIGTIRKHSKWLWAIIITLTIVSFLGWNVFTRTGNNGGGGSSDLGTIYGHKITQQDFLDARNEFYIFYLVHYREWPDKLSKDEVERETYVRLLLTQKGNELGIHVSDEAAAMAASEMLHALGRNGQAVSPEEFVKQILEPKGMTAVDFERFARHDLVIQQLIATLGLAGQLVTPQEAAAAYAREHQEISAQIVFFSASNYLSQVTVTPLEVGQFYTNYLAAYRLPDRVQISYVEFNVTNFLAQAKAEWARTNLEEVVTANFNRFGENYQGAKSPAEAKEKIRDELIHDRALADAHAQANDLATAVFNLEPARAENLAAVARQKGLSVHLTAPFTADSGPAEFTAPEGFGKIAAGLTADEPFVNPIIGPEGVYVIALARQLPSEIPPFSEIHNRVMQDYRMQTAVALAQQAGTNFTYTLKTSAVAGKSFAAACLAAGLPPQVLPPFSLSTRELPQLGDRADLNQIKQAAFSTPAGHASGFEPDPAGGFILYVQSQLPLDQSAMDAELPQFTATLRRARQNEAFNEWLGAEANRVLHNTPLARDAGLN